MAQLNQNPMLQDPSLMSSIGTQTLSGLEYVGGLLDKLTGSRAIRGGLDGNFNELLSIIPGSDTFGITDPEQAVSGRDLAESYGLLAPNEPGLDWGDVGGFAAEVALDPTAWASFGTTALARNLLPEAGTAALRGLGKTATLPTRAAWGGLNEVVGASPDFLNAVPLGAGRVVSGGLKGGVIDPLLNTDTGRALKGVFNSDYRGTITEAGQNEALKNTRAVEKSTAEARGDFAKLRTILEQNGILNDKSAPDLRRALEGITEGIDPAIVDVATRMREGLAPMLEELQGMGLSSGALDDAADIDYFPRRHEDTGGQRGASTGKAFTTQDPFSISRKKYLKGIRGGTEQLKDIIKDPAVTGAKTTLDARNYILKKYGDKLPPYKMSDNFKQVFEGMENNGVKGMHAIEAVIKAEEKKLRKLKKTDPNAVASPELIEARSIRKLRRGRTTKMADWIRNSMTDEMRAGGYYDRHPLVDLEDYMVRMGSVREGGKSVISATSDLLKTPFSPTAGDKGMSVNDLLAGARMNRNHNAKIKIGKALGLDMTVKANIAEVGRMRVPSKEGADLVKVVDSFTRPKAAGEITKLWDSYTSMFKAGVLTWPARFVRDATTGAYLNFIRGVKPRHYADSLNLFAKETWASKLLNLGDSSGIVKGAAKKYPPVAKWLDEQGLPHTDENATQALKDLIYQYEVASSRQADLASSAMAQPSSLDEKLGEFVGSRPTGPWEAIKQMRPKKVSDLYPNKIRGVRQKGGAVRETTENTIVKGGEELAYGVEATNRLPAFLKYLEDGVDPLEAAKNVREMHVDYRPEAFSGTERQIRKIVPFYSWQKGMLPYMVKQLANSPGGAVAQSIRGQRNLTQEEGGFMPADLRRQTSFLAPEVLGSDNLPPGTSRFVTGLGLPQENVFENFVVKGSPGTTIAATLQRSAAMLHPVFKAVIETATGTNLYTGRELQDLDSPTERLLRNVTGDDTFQMPQLLDTVIQNSPATRLLNTARQWTDPRDENHVKAMFNTFTGARLSDVDLEKRREIEIREQAVEGLGDQARTFRSVYIPKKTLAQLEMTDPDWFPGGSKRSLLDLYQSMNK